MDIQSGAMMSGKANGQDLSKQTVMDSLSPEQRKSLSMGVTAEMWEAGEASDEAVWDYLTGNPDWQKMPRKEISQTIMKVGRDAYEKYMAAHSMKKA